MISWGAPHNGAVDPLEHSAGALEARIRGTPHGVLVAEGTPHSTWVLVDPRQGSVVLSAPASVWDRSGELVLFVPDESADSAQLLLASAREPEASAVDRYQAHFGVPRGVVVRACEIESVRWGGSVFDVDEIALANPWHAEEPALLRTANEDPSRLERACGILGHGTSAPLVAVGVDPDGLNVRARTGITRIAFSERATTGSAASRAVREALEAGGAA